MADGKLVYVAGASRSGKTRTTARELRKARRVFVWDPKGDWTREHHFERVSGDRELLALSRNGTHGRWAFFPVTPDADTFARWATAAWWWARARRAKAVIVADELSQVTSPGKAPRGWHRIVSQGLGFGIDVYAITQRPAESDKSALGNASVIRCGRLSRAVDRKAVAADMDLPFLRLEDITPGELLERDLRTGKIRTLKL